ncbi:unnamed protein product [Sphenostylis stenocarpa]|uniref:Uncharacterized protein n=1 Tax=Sphenostylis stenocarpa TaxID=92480 RepID=A0AA86VAT2_9FABA|nr:unnamed protein product [Sphenostylis stenocarpa]
MLLQGDFIDLDWPFESKELRTNPSFSREGQKITIKVLISDLNFLQALKLTIEPDDYPLLGACGSVVDRICVRTKKELG